MKGQLCRLLMILLLALVPAAPAVAGPASGYLIGTGDVLKISVYDHQDLATLARVDERGEIAVPLAGQVKVGGLTASAAARLIAGQLSGDYIVNPQVAVFVEEFHSKRVTVLGEITRPGIYQLTGPTTLLELLSQAGGLTRGAGRSATIYRDAQSGQTLTVDLQAQNAAGNSAAAVQLLDGDTVTIDRAGVVYVTGEVNRPAAYTLEAEMTVIKAVTVAGGFTPLASQGRIKIIRKINGSEQVLERVSLHDKLISEDVMVVPESFF